MSPPLLRVENLRTHFRTRNGVVRAVDDVSFSLERGKIVGLVGESGSGKSMTGYSIMGLVDPPGTIVGGRVLLNDVDLRRLSEGEMRELRGNRVAMIFQDPRMALNPVLRIDTQLIEAVRAHHGVDRRTARERSLEMLARVGIASPEERLLAYPHQFSGGMRQRVAIAIALINHPDLIIADEPTTALDVTVQAQILHEVQVLCREWGTALIWITHDLAVISGLADEVMVMYAGKLVERGTVDEVLDSPLHPYTRGLIDSVPSRNPRGRLLKQIPGMTPSLAQLPAGCAFRERCPRASEICATLPSLYANPPGHAVRCFHPCMTEEIVRS